MSGDGLQASLKMHLVQTSPTPSSLLVTEVIALMTHHKRKHTLVHSLGGTDPRDCPNASGSWKPSGSAVGRHDFGGGGLRSCGTIPECLLPRSSHPPVLARLCSSSRHGPEQVVRRYGCQCAAAVSFSRLGIHGGAGTCVLYWGGTRGIEYRCANERGALFRR